jgi:hypothetical protein
MSRQRSGGQQPPGQLSSAAPQRRPVLTLVGPAAYPRQHGPELAVLTNRIAAMLVHHDPGWRLPRPTVLARHYDVTTELVEAALGQLAARRLIRRLPDGRACRTSPAHYVLPLRRTQGLTAQAEAVSNDLTLGSISVSWHPVRDEVRRALDVPAAAPVGTIQLIWTIAAEPAAATTTYTTKDLVEPLVAAAERARPDPIGAVLPLAALRYEQDECGARPAVLLVPRTLHIEVQQPPHWAARALGLSACEHAVVVTAACGEQAASRNAAGPNAAGPNAASRNAALTIAAFLPGAFRISIASSGTPLDGQGTSLAQPSWAHLDAEWDA